MGRWLKKVQECTAEAPTKLTERGFVGFVSAPADHVQEKVNLEIEAVAANDQLLTSRNWLDCIAQKLGTDVEDLLTNGYLESHDLEEWAGCDTDLAVHLIRHSPAWINRPPSVARSTEYISGAISESQHVIHTAATATPEWLAVRDRFIKHLMRCRACHTPSNRYCLEGTQLRQAYNRMCAEDIQ